MKRVLKGLLVLFMTVLLSVGFVGCGNKDADGYISYRIVFSESNENVRAEICVLELDGKYTLMQLMEKAKASGDLTYETSGGMITSINNVANAADFSSCWMLYTSDKEMANAEWGTISYGDKKLGSAIVGADALEVLEGEIYVWEYVTF